MKNKTIACVVLLSLLLSGCSNGEHVSVTTPSGESTTPSASAELPRPEEPVVIQSNFKKTYDGQFMITNYYNDSRYYTFTVMKNKTIKYGFINTKENILIDPIYDSILQLRYFRFEEGLEPVSKDRKWGYIDTKGNTVIDFTYDQANNFMDGYAVVYKGNKAGIIDKQNKVILDFEYDDVYAWESGKFQIIKGKKQGLYTIDGGIIVNPDYDEICNHGSVYTAVRGEYTDLYDDKGNLLKSFEGYITIDHAFDTTTQVNAGPMVIIYQVKEKFGAFKYEKGQLTELAKPVYDQLNMNNDQLDYCKYFLDSNGEYSGDDRGLITWDGNIRKMDGAGAESYAPVINGMKIYYTEQGMGFKDKDDNIVIKPIYMCVEDFAANGIAVVETKNQESALIDKQGNVLIKEKNAGITPLIADNEDYMPSPETMDARYYTVSFENGFLRVFDTQSKDYMTGKYNAVDLMDDYLIVTINDKTGLLDQSGKVLVEPREHFSYTEYKQGYYQNNNGDLYYLTDLKGKTTHENNYQRIGSINEYGRRIVTINDKQMVTDRDGNPLLDGLYDEIFFVNKTHVICITRSAQNTTIETVTLS